MLEYFYIERGLLTNLVPRASHLHRPLEDGKMRDLGNEVSLLIYRKGVYSETLPYHHLVTEAKFLVPAQRPWWENLVNAPPTQLWTKLRIQTVTKAAECGLIKFFFLAIAQSNSLLFWKAVFNGIKPLWDEAAFPKLVIFSVRCGSLCDTTQGK